jgi:hypothetical protein
MLHELLVRSRSSKCRFTIANVTVAHANMREHGVRSLSVTCELCHHAALMNVDALDDAIPVAAFGSRMVCASCGIVGANAAVLARAVALNSHRRFGNRAPGAAAGASSPIKA